MPADDTIWRSLKRMHVIFAVSCVGLLLVTLWMMAADHRDEWRNYADVTDRIQDLKFSRELAAENAKSDRDRIESIFAAVEDLREPELARTLRDEYGRIEGEGGDYHSKVQRLIDYTQTTRSADLQTEIERLRNQIPDVRRREDLLARRVRALRAERDKARADYDLAVDRGLSEVIQDERAAVFDDFQAQVDVLELEHQQVETDLKQAQRELEQMTKVVETLRAALTKELAEAERIKSARDRIAPPGWFASAKRKVMQWPVIDGFNSPHKVDQIWLPELDQTLGMAKADRYDRCRTCHRLIDTVAAGNKPAYPFGASQSHDPADWVAAGAYPHPYATHPNTDLYLTASSPHPLMEFGCTGCHQGQGSGTSFSNASHTPNDPYDDEVWHHEYGYASNHFWEYPMLPERFRESSCIRCHPNVVELGVHPEFGNSAPKLYRGYQLVRDFGCFGCHEIHGFDAGQTIGPDMRLEPQTAEERQKLADDPNQIPGTMRKVGPSLRHIAEKTTEAWVQYWTEEPKRFRPTTRMPQFFKLTNQINWESAVVLQKLAHGEDLTLADGDPVAARFQPVELAGIARYLFDKSEQLGERLPPDKQLDRLGDHLPDATRGKALFSKRGCLACHSHREFPEVKADFGPDLSRVHEKLPHGGGQPLIESIGFQWLYGWVQDPTLYHPRTKMPNLYLEPAEAADIAAWLLSGAAADYADLNEQVTDAHLDELVRLLLQKSQTVAQVDQALGKDMDGQPVDHARAGSYDLAGSADIKGDEVELVYRGEVVSAVSDRELRVQFSSRKVEPGSSPQLIWASGASAHLAFGVASYDTGSGTLTLDRSMRFTPEPGDPFVLSGHITRDMKLNYVGRRTISRYGCYGCHDIPGFETARPIGTTLQDWGRKDPSRLALEHIEDYLHHHGEPDGSSTRERAVVALKAARAGGLEAGMFASPEQAEREMAVTYYYEKLLHHGRDGFLWQKLRQPRSYDYKKIDTKGYEERLRMPRFQFSGDPLQNEDDIDAIATFILGLVAEPPPGQYLYQPTGPAADRLEGERLLEKYNCLGCHVIDLPTIRYGIAPREPGLPRGLSDLVGMTREDLVAWFSEHSREILAASRTSPKVEESVAVPDDIRTLLANTADLLDSVSLGELSQIVEGQSGPQAIAGLRRRLSFLDDSELQAIVQALPGWTAASAELGTLPTPVPPELTAREGELRQQVDVASKAIADPLSANGIRKWIVDLARIAGRERRGQALDRWFGEHPEVLLADRLPADTYPEALRALLELKPPRSVAADERQLNPLRFGEWLQQWNFTEQEQQAAAEPAAALQERIDLFDRQIDELRQAGVSMARLRRLAERLLDEDVGELLHPYGGETDPEKLPLKDELTSLFVEYQPELTRALGQPVIAFHGLLFQGENPDFAPYEQEYSYDMWETLVVGGRVLPSGVLRVKPLALLDAAADGVYTNRGRGGEFAHWLVDVLIAERGGKAENKRDMAWQMSPPPLYLEGRKVQTPWLYQFLKNPQRLRHETVLRMPQFNIDDNEARALANYFAAADGANYPYQAIEQRDPAYLGAARRRLDQLESGNSEDYLAEGWAVLNGNVCIGCHAVGTRPFAPTPTSTRGPDLEGAADRLRPEWLKLWLLKPKYLTPYTSMPVNFPANQVVFPDRFAGVGPAQVVGVRDALLNYQTMMDRLAKHGTTEPSAADSAGNAQPPGRQPDP